MATSVLVAATDHQTTNPSLQSMTQDHDHDHQPIRRSSGRRKPKACDSSAGQKKKQPQRGMGVEKLERLRLQERWKKMTEINTTNQAFSIPAAASFPDPTLINTCVPLQISKLGGFGAPHVCQMGLKGQNQTYLGFHGQMGVGGLASDQLQTDLFGIGCFNESGFLGKNVTTGISKELSSTPNVVKCYSEHCTACHKKKKANGDNLGSSRVRPDTYMQMSNYGECGFLGLNIGDNQNIVNQENQGIGRNAPLSPQLGMGYADANGKHHEGSVAEVVAVHRKGSSSSEGIVLMEYEFFPGCCTSKYDSDHDQLVMMKKVEEVGETFTFSSSSIDASNCIDLSLRLSY